MVTRRPLPRDRSTAASPDGAYAVVAGCYVAALLTPAAMVVLAQFLHSAGGRYVGFLCTVAGVAAAAGLLVARTPGLAVRLGRHPATRLLALVPLLWVGGLVGVAVLDSPVSSSALLVAGLCGVAGAVLGLVLSTMSRNRYAAACLVGVERRVEWEARWPRRWRRASLVIVVVTGGLGALGLLGRFVAALDALAVLVPLVYVWPVFAGVYNPRTFAVTDVGLVVERPLVRRLRPWAAIEGYALTADAIVVRQRAWWRPALRSDRNDVADVDAVVAALESATAD
jgi:hypothetical protein